MTEPLQTTVKTDPGVHTQLHVYQALSLPVYLATSETGRDWIRMRLNEVFGAISMPSKLAAGIPFQLQHAPVIQNAMTQRTIVLVAYGRKPDETTIRQLTGLGVTISEKGSTIVLPGSPDCPFHWVSGIPHRGMIFPSIDDVLGALYASTAALGGKADE
jgi:hypothetical protein